MTLFSEGDKKKVVPLKGNTLVVMQSRRVEYEVECGEGKTFMMYAKISGPKDDERGI